MESLMVEKICSLLQATVLTLCQHVIVYNTELVVQGIITVEADGKEVCTVNFKETKENEQRTEELAATTADTCQSSRSDTPTITISPDNNPAPGLWKQSAVPEFDMRNGPYERELQSRATEIRQNGQSALVQLSQITVPDSLTRGSTSTTSSPYSMPAQLSTFGKPLLQQSQPASIYVTNLRQSAASNEPLPTGNATHFSSADKRPPSTSREMPFHITSEPFGNSSQIINIGPLSSLNASTNALQEPYSCNGRVSTTNRFTHGRASPSFAAAQSNFPPPNPYPKPPSKIQDISSKAGLDARLSDGDMSRSASSTPSGPHLNTSSGLSSIRAGSADGYRNTPPPIEKAGPSSSPPKQEELLDSMVAKAMKLWYDDEKDLLGMSGVEDENEGAGSVEKLNAFSIDEMPIDLCGDEDMTTSELIDDDNNFGNNSSQYLTGNEVDSGMIKTSSQATSEIVQDQSSMKYPASNLLQRILEAPRQVNVSSYDRPLATSGVRWQERYKCSMCSKGFSSSSNLARHQRSTHGRMPTLRPFKAAASSSSDLASDGPGGQGSSELTSGATNSHVELVIPTVNRTTRLVPAISTACFSCEACRKKFFTKKGLRGHRCHPTATDMTKNKHLAIKESVEDLEEEITPKPIKAVESYLSSRNSPALNDSTALSSAPNRNSLATVSSLTPSAGKLPTEYSASSSSSSEAAVSNVSSIVTTSSGQFQCPMCKNSFLLYQNLGRHVKFNHGLELADLEKKLASPAAVSPSVSKLLKAPSARSYRPPEEPRSYPCKLCGRIFNYSSNRSRHMSQVHRISAGLGSNNQRQDRSTSE